jgi:hypothetical protein
VKYSATPQILPRTLPLLVHHIFSGAYAPLLQLQMVRGLSARLLRGLDWRASRTTAPSRHRRASDTFWPTAAAKTYGRLPRFPGRAPSIDAPPAPSARRQS